MFEPVDLIWQVQACPGFSEAFIVAVAETRITKGDPVLFNWGEGWCSISEKGLCVEIHAEQTVISVSHVE